MTAGILLGRLPALFLLVSGIEPLTFPALIFPASQMPLMAVS